MKIEEVLQIINELIAYYGADANLREGAPDERVYHEGAFDALRDLRDEIKQRGGIE